MADIISGLTGIEPAQGHLLRSIRHRLAWQTQVQTGRRFQVAQLPLQIHMACSFAIECRVDETALTLSTWHPLQPFFS
jgi:hypothetical protein